MAYSRIIKVDYMPMHPNSLKKSESNMSPIQSTSNRKSKRESRLSSVQSVSSRSSKRESDAPSSMLGTLETLKEVIPAIQKSKTTHKKPPKQEKVPFNGKGYRERVLPQIPSQKGGKPQPQKYEETSSLNNRKHGSRTKAPLPHIRSRRLSIRESTILKAPPFILMSDDEKLIEAERYTSNQLARRPSIMRFRKRQEQFQQLSERVHRSFDLDFEIVKKVVAYAKSLPISGSNMIDRNIFDAQMSRHFNLTNKKYLPQMYRVCCLDPKQEGKVHVAEYAELICIFLSRNFDLKIQFVFKVYNWRNDGILNMRDLDYYITCITDGYIYNDDEDIDDLKQWLLKLLKRMDHNSDMDIDLDEYREIVNREPLMLQMLGPCMPDQHKIVNFRTLLEDRSVMECSALFRFERQISLCAPDKHFMTGDIQKYYSVPLDLI